MWTFEGYVGWFLDEQIESGRIDAVRELAGPVAALLTKEVVGPPLSEWRYYVEVFQNSKTYSVDSPEAAALAEFMTGMANTLIGQLESRRLQPRNDLLTGLVEFRKPDGEALNDAELLGQVWFVISGGLDTMTSVIANALDYPAKHPDQRMRTCALERFLKQLTRSMVSWADVRESVPYASRRARSGEPVTAMDATATTVAAGER